MANIPHEAQILISTIKVARPIHWVKNLALFAALIFTGGLFNRILFQQVVWAFIAFNFATSATYILNDIIDVKSDRLHPVKRNRPIAKGTLPVSLAAVEAFIFATIAISLAHSLSSLFFLLVIGYLFMQAAYSLGLKNLTAIDILIIATGFVIRVYAGAFAINAHLSVWFLLCVISVALFLASGKRRAELGLLGKDGKTRKSLQLYSRDLLNSYVTMFGNAAWMSWALFTFYESPKAARPIWLILAEFSETTTIDKLLMATIPVTIFGIMRYESLIFEGRAETPEKLLLTDNALVASVVIWVAMVIWILYGGVSITVA